MALRALRRHTTWSCQYCGMKWVLSFVGYHGLPEGVCGYSSSVCCLLYVSSSGVSPREEAVVCFEFLDVQMEREPNSHFATVTGMDYSAKLVLATETDLC